MVMASASVFEALGICGEPHTLITQRNLGLHRLEQIGYAWKKKAKDPRTEIVRGPFVTLDVRK